MSKYFEANAGCTKPTELKKIVWIEKRIFLWETGGVPDVFHSEFELVLVK